MMLGHGLLFIGVLPDQKHVKVVEAGETYGFLDHVISMYLTLNADEGRPKLVLPRRFMLPPRIKVCAQTKLLICLFFFFS